MLTSLGIVLFHALDFGLCDDEERTLSKPLELLIQKLTTAEDSARRYRRTNRRVHANSESMQNSIGSLQGDELVDDEEDDDEDECANADEGIERDCHEFGDVRSHQLVDMEQVLQVSAVFNWRCSYSLVMDSVGQW